MSQSLIKHLAKVALECKSNIDEENEEDDISRITDDEEVHNSLLLPELDDYSLN